MAKGDRKRSRVTRAGIGAYAKCPFCGYQVSLNPTMPWCVNCRCEHDEDTFEPANDWREFIWFDRSRKTPRFALAKALNACGGVRIGK